MNNMLKFTPLPSIDKLHQILRIDETSCTWLRWKEGKRGCRAGAVAGCFKKEQWGNICIYGKYYKIHRIVWALANNSDPGHYPIDHINRVPHDNNPKNLRLATSALNRYNSSFDKNSTGYRGVTKMKDCNRWMSRIKKDGKSFYLGCFKSAQEAHDAYIEACIKLYGFIPERGLAAN
jgi:hypothetical protein